MGLAEALTGLGRREEGLGQARAARRTVGDFAAALPEARRAVLLGAEPVAAILAG